MGIQRGIATAAVAFFTLVLLGGCTNDQDEGSGGSGGSGSDSDDDEAIHNATWTNPVTVTFPTTTYPQKCGIGFGTSFATAAEIFDPSDPETYSWSFEATAKDSRDYEHTVAIFIQDYYVDGTQTAISSQAFVYFDPLLNGTDIDITGHALNGEPTPLLLTFTDDHLTAITQADGTPLADMTVDYTAHPIDLHGGAKDIQIKVDFSTLKREVPPTVCVDNPEPNLTLSVELNASAPAFGTNSATAIELFDPSDPATYNRIVLGTMLDSFSVPHDIHVFFQRVGDSAGLPSNMWNAFIYMDAQFDGIDTDITGDAGHTESDNPAPTPHVIEFDSAGNFISMMQPDGRVTDTPFADYTDFPSATGGGAADITILLKYDSISM